MAEWLRRKYRAMSRDRRGFLVVAVGIMFLSCFFAGLTIDVGHVYLVKGELQNAADATALAGAGNLHAGSPLRIVEWSVAETEAKKYLGKNRADGQPLQDCQMVSGFWDMRTPAIKELQPSVAFTGICSISKKDCNNDSECPAEGCLQVKVPGMRVTVNKSSDSNGGPVKTFFSPIIGWTGFEPSASALAISGYPGSVPAGVLFPFAIRDCEKNKLLTGETAPDDIIVLTTDGVTGVGYWSDLSADLSADRSRSTKMIYDIINTLADTNSRRDLFPPALSVGDIISLDELNDRSPLPAIDRLITEGKAVVLMPIIQCDIEVNTTYVVKGFVGMELTEIGVDRQRVEGKFKEYILPSGTGLGGEATNIVIPPKLID